MNKILNEIKFWWNASRGYTTPVTIMSWSVPFIFALSEGGNIFFGILALIGILSVHLGVNLFDDIVDYYFEKYKTKKGLQNTINFQKGKCKYIIDGHATYRIILLITFCLFALGGLIGLFFVWKCGLPVLYIMLITAFLCVLYPLVTYIGLGEIIVGTVYAPLLYSGVYFVMTKSFSVEILLVSISTGLLTIGLLNAHTFMDFDFDKRNRKITLCTIAKTKHNAVKTEGAIFILAMLNIIILVSIGKLPPIMLLTLGTIPLMITLYELLYRHIENPNIYIKAKFWMGPIENWNEIVKNKNEGFMQKFLLARNVMFIFTLLLCIAKIIEEIRKCI
ncbi:MAG: prenyltransferase [Candidatus Gastranaerophilales bacterium]|nr:prenyltransferase [Candidatus Gastranaerophilales bacterium]